LSIAVALKPDGGLPGEAGSLNATGDTPSPDDALAGYRDLGRSLDAYKVAGALLRYHSDHRAYPSGAPGVHTLCADEADAGCALRPYLDPVPMDSRGDPKVNGYWYESDGMSSTLYLSMELARNAAPAGCPQPAPSELANVPNFYCVTLGPPP
jgi:hypothetical protein